MLADLASRLERYLASRPAYSAATYVNSGGSAAIFKVLTPAGLIAIKVYVPEFLQGSNALPERRRLELQRSLIGHGCETLVNINSVVEEQDTAFIEMDFVEWPQLKEVLNSIPDESISSLVGQLVSTVLYLERRGIVHRDIKPENIHVSPDFSALKLIDLGVARELAVAEDECGASTDQGDQRPFIATAQYSSPEYLFRLDAPSVELWKGLNLYQVGAVLHDLINKRPLFDREVSMGNRWLVARSVLTQVPRFPDTNLGRLAPHKALAARCLVKNLATRLALVDWSDFALEAAGNPLDRLKGRLSKGQSAIGTQAKELGAERLDFERVTFIQRLISAVRMELIAACGNKIPFSVLPDQVDGATRLQFIASPDLNIEASLKFEWLDELHEKSANVFLSCTVLKSGRTSVTVTESLRTVATINESEDVSCYQISADIAECVMRGLDIIDSGASADDIHATDLVDIALGGAASK